jgi:hypothetical protein
MSWQFAGLVGAMVMLVCTHLFYPQFENSRLGRQDWWVPFTGGAAIGYVFLFMLPKIGDYTAYVINREPHAWEFWQYRLYTLVLVGLLFFYIVDRYRDLSAHVHWVVGVQSIGFGLYSFTLGYLLPTLRREGYVPYLLLGLIFGLHLAGLNHQLRLRHRKVFDERLRYFFAASILAGWLMGLQFPLPVRLMAAITAFVAGGIIVNVMLEELPDRDDDRLWPFIAGVFFFLMSIVVVHAGSTGID